jgi:hypothetical protein
MPRYPACSTPEPDQRIAHLCAYTEATLRERLAELGYPADEVIAAVRRGRRIIEVCAEYRMTGRISR